MITQGKAGYAVTDIVLHTAALWTGQADNWSAAKMRSVIRGWHVDRGWRREGYHWMMALNGDLADGRPIYEIGAGVAGHNRGKIHVCLANKVTHNGIASFETYFTPQQRESLHGLLRVLLFQGGGEITRILGHNDFTDLKECPGFKVLEDRGIQGVLRSYRISRGAAL